MCEKSEPRGKLSTRSCSGPDDPAFPPARLFCGCFSAFEELFDPAGERLAEIFGPILKKSPIFDFPETRVYGPTMGRDLKRIFFVFKNLYPQDGLSEAKKKTCALEEEIRRSRKWPVPRPINLDPGLVAEARLVLASTKDRAHRLPRADGIYEEITLIFFEGSFRPLMWTYPDFRNPDYHRFFEEVRREYLAETREIRRRFHEGEGRRPAHP